MRMRRVFLVTLFGLLSISAVLGQTSTGEVNGTITDPTGAAVPNATVKLVGKETGIETQATTREDGYYRFVNVKPGVYTLNVEVSGFKRVVTNAITLGVSETSTQNIALQVGSV